MVIFGADCEAEGLRGDRGHEAYVHGRTHRSTRQTDTVCCKSKPVKAALPFDIYPLVHTLNTSQTDHSLLTLLNLTPLQVGTIPFLADRTSPTRPQRSHFASVSPGQPRAQGRPARGFPGSPSPGPGKARPLKIPFPLPTASPSRPTGPPFSPSGSRSETDYFFKSSSLDWLQASGSLWPKLKPGTIPVQVSSQCPVYLYSTNDWNHYAPD